MGFAASNEDGWLIQFFGRDSVGHAVEVGAFDGVTGSNTLALEHSGWKVLCVEPNPAMVAALHEMRDLYWSGACSDFNGTARFHINASQPPCYSSLRPTTDHPQWHPEPDDQWYEREVEVRTLDSLLDEFKFPGLDVLSIDTEGTEMDVLHGIDLVRWKPRVIIVEAWDADNPITPYLEKYGYRRVDRRLVNDIYTRDWTP